MTLRFMMQTEKPKPILAKAAAETYRGKSHGMSELII